jgi:predicted SprT family Zn-dependent metalloprotease
MINKLPKLQYWADRYAKMYWGRHILHPVEWNKRLRNCWGCVKWRKINGKITPIKIEINPKAIHAKDGQFHKTLKHELCHYFLLLEGKNHGEHDEVFLSELRRVGGSMPIKVLYWDFYCGVCGAFVYSNRRFSWDRFLQLRKEICSCQRHYVSKHPVTKRLT